MIEARKLSFQEVWNSATIFFMDDELEQEIDKEIEALLKTARDQRISAAMVNEAEPMGVGKGIVLKMLFGRDWSVLKRRTA